MIKLFSCSGEKFILRQIILNYVHFAFLPAVSRDSVAVGCSPTPLDFPSVSFAHLFVALNPEAL